MSSQLSLFGEPLEILRTPSERVQEALPLVESMINATDPDGILSDLQAVHVAVSALKRSAPKFDAAINDWAPFAMASMRAELLRAIERGEHQHAVERLACLVFESHSDNVSEVGK